MQSLFCMKSRWKFSIEIRLKVVKIAKNMTKELRISRSSISEILLKFQNMVIVTNQPQYGCPWKLQHRLVWKLVRAAKDKWWMSVTCPSWCQQIPLSASFEKIHCSDIFQLINKTHLKTRLVKRSKNYGM